MAVCTMNRSGAAPCQCSSPGGVQITSPGRITRTFPPRDCTRPTPSVTCSVCPRACECHAVRAQGAKRTVFTRAVSLRAMTSKYTSPVNVSAGPLVVGCFSTISTDLSSAVRSGPDEDLERLAGVHRAVRVGHAVEVDGPVEDLAGLDAARQDVGQQLLDVGAYGIGPPVRVMVPPNMLPNPMGACSACGRTTASLGSCSVGSGRSSTRTSPAPQMTVARTKIVPIDGVVVPPPGNTRPRRGGRACRDGYWQGPPHRLGPTSLILTGTPERSER